MKPILLAALALPVLLTGCATDVAVGTGYGPGYYDGGYYGSPVVGVYNYGGYGYNRGYYRHYDHNYNGGPRIASISRNSHGYSHHTSVASVNRGSGRSTATRSSNVSASSGAGHVGGGGHR